MTDFTEPVIRVDVEGLHVISEELAAKLAKKNLSPSMITSLAQCPAKWLGESLVVRDLIEEEPDNAARRGTMFHKVMEIFFACAPEERTVPKIKEVVAEVLASDDYKDLADIPEAVKWLRDAVNGYYTMGAKPEKVSIASIKDGKTGADKIGLEVFVKGRIGDTKREILGFIDRLVEDPREEGAVVVEDWKTGAKSKRWNPASKGDDGRAEARQQVIYAKLLEAQGVKVTGARLIFPMVPDIVNVDLNDEEFAESVVADVEEADAKLDVFIELNTFEYNPSFLCAWCSLAKICPSAQIKPYAKMREAYAKQPSIDVLAKGFDFQ
jgi:RecB family exonuclease